MKLLPLLLLLAAPALAYPPPGVDMTSPTAQWFQSLQIDGHSCCGLGDCRAVEAEWKAGHWWVWVKHSYLKSQGPDGLDPSKNAYTLEPPQFVPNESREGETLVQVPDKIVQNRDDNPTGHSVLCASPVQPDTVMYCFIPDVGI
jgi:hypothetical protein